MATDFTPLFQKYLTLLGKNEKSVTQGAKIVRAWVSENGEIVRDKIEEQVEESISKMGFVKVREVKKLEARISALEAIIENGQKKPLTKKPAAEKPATKRAAKKSVRNTK